MEGPIIYWWWDAGYLEFFSPNLSTFFCSVITKSYFCFPSFPHILKVRMLMQAAGSEKGDKGCEPAPGEQWSLSPWAVVGSRSHFLRRQKHRTSSFWDYLFLEAFKSTGGTFCLYRVPSLSKCQLSGPGFCWWLAACRRDCWGQRARGRINERFVAQGTGDTDKKRQGRKIWFQTRR